MSERILVGTRKGLFSVRKVGPSRQPWQISDTAFLGDPVSMVLASSGSGRMHAALDHGHFGTKMQRSDDGGQTWSEAPVPTFPEKPENEDDRDPIRDESIPWAVKLIWALEFGHATRPDELWCGTIPGGLFRSSDAGDSWELIRPLWDHPKRREWFGGGADLPGIHSILVDPRSPDRVIIGVSCGGVWITTDGGANWRCSADGMRAEYLPPGQQGDPNTQDPHRLVHCQSAPDNMWVQHHNGIFKSTDGAASWHEIDSAKPSAFGFAVAVHPTDPATAWFVPAIKDEKRYPVDGNVVVSRTRDGGQSFEVLSNGLPQGHAYDLTYRHALDIDESGERLAFGSTTGSLWVSEDQGDSWITVCEHLPPVYCVRFA